VRAVKGPYRDPYMQRWVVLLIFDVMPENNLFNVLAQVQMYFNLGNGDNPRAGRRSKYFHEWCKAVGGHMRRGDRIKPRVFANRFARIKVRDTERSLHDSKCAAAPYSVVDEILEWETGMAEKLSSRPTQFKLCHSRNQQIKKAAGKGPYVKRLHRIDGKTEALRSWRKQRAQRFGPSRGRESRQHNSRGGQAERPCPSKAAYRRGTSLNKWRHARAREVVRRTRAEMTFREQSSVRTQQKKVQNAIGRDHECEKGAKKKGQVTACCGTKSPRAQECDLRRGHRGPHSWSWMRN
jgi:hypothetical protein